MHLVNDKPARQAFAAFSVIHSVQCVSNAAVVAFGFMTAVVVMFAVISPAAVVAV